MLWSAGRASSITSPRPCTLPPDDQGRPSLAHCLNPPCHQHAWRHALAGLRWAKAGVTVWSVQCSATDVVDDPDVRFPVFTSVVVTVDTNGSKPGREDVVAGLGEAHLGP